MRKTDRDYLERRVTEELRCAQNGASPQAVRAHYQLLGLYLDQLYADERGTEISPAVSQQTVNRAGE